MCSIVCEFVSFCGKGLYVCISFFCDWVRQCVRVCVCVCVGDLFSVYLPGLCRCSHRHLHPNFSLTHSLTHSLTLSSPALSLTRSSPPLFPSVRPDPAGL